MSPAVRRARPLKTETLKKPGRRTVPPSLREERRLLRSGHILVAAIDEVGRGALAGPVTVGIVVVDAETKSAPTGVRDSKLLTPEARVRLAPRLRRWAPVHAVGHASSYEIDRIGIIAALRLAACRALAELPLRPDCALLDGSHNWLSIPITPPDPEPSEAAALFEFEVPPTVIAQPDAPEIRPELVPERVVTQVKADLRCAAVAAASVLAKVERDAIMVRLADRFPEYGWQFNKGYSAPEHKAALRRHGPSELHRQSWNLLGGEFLSLDDAIPELVYLEEPAEIEDDDPRDGADLTEAELEELDELEEVDLTEDDEAPVR